MRRLSVIALAAMAWSPACARAGVEERAVYAAALREIAKTGASSPTIFVDDRVLLQTGDGIPFPGDQAEHFGAKSQAIEQAATDAGVSVCPRPAGTCVVSEGESYTALTEITSLDSDTAVLGAIMVERNEELTAVHYYKVLVFPVGGRMDARVEWVGVDN